MPKNATFALSYFGQQYVIDEGFSELPTIRLVFVMATVVLGLLAVFRLSMRYWALWLERGQNQLMTVLFWTLFANVAIHTTHYADNIARPVAYFEPKWLYESYLLSTMEITFYVNLVYVPLVTIYGSRLFDALVTGDAQETRHACIGVSGSVFISFMTLLHYRIEPPTSFTAMRNFTILGEGFLAAVLVGVLVKVWRQRHDREIELIREMNKFIEKSGDDASDDEEEEIETFSQQGVRLRSRSRDRQLAQDKELYIE